MKPHLHRLDTMSDDDNRDDINSEDDCLSMIEECEDVEEHTSSNNGLSFAHLDGNGSGGANALSESGDTSSVQNRNANSDNSNSTNSKNQEKNRGIAFSRLVVMTVMKVSAFSIAALTYHVINKDQHDDFIDEFESSTRQIVHMANKNVQNVHVAIRTVANLFPAAAHQSSSTLPFITINDFESLGVGIRQISQASIIAYTPVLTSAAELEAWNVSSTKHSDWITTPLNGTSNQPTITTYVHQRDAANNRTVPAYATNGTFAPLWQMTPIPLNDGTSMINYDLASNAVYGELLHRVILSGVETFSEIVNPHEMFGSAVEHYSGEGPTSILMHPIFADHADTDTSTGIETTPRTPGTAVISTEEPQQSHPRVVGVVSALIPWKDIFRDVLPEGRGNVIVVADSCGMNNTFLIRGNADIEFVGTGDRHDKAFASTETFFEFEFDTARQNEGSYCHQHIHMFATRAMKDSFETNAPILYATVIVLLFLFTEVVFLFYDSMVNARQNRTQTKADTQEAIVQELFPGNVAAKLYKRESMDIDDDNDHHADSSLLNGMLGGSKDSSGAAARTTIADLYPAATVLFADIAGFTAWSSMRDPHQVFKLLESVFQAFDVIAKKLGIFKVETIGDCYVAVCGVPKANADHAVQMARFARAALIQFTTIVRRLEVTLGPDTMDLGLRIGMHSGPVTAGVLRGDRARFQLFGDTVNTASRIESTGRRSRIHVSEQTAVELVAHGKQDWVVLRDDAVEAKGKGKLVTYWLKPGQGATSSRGSSVDGDRTESAESVESSSRSLMSKLKEECRNSPTKGVKPSVLQMDDHRVARLVEWNSDLLLQLLQPIVARRAALSGGGASSSRKEDLSLLVEKIGVDSNMLHEVVDAIDMPDATNAAAAATTRQTKAPIKLSSKVVHQMRRYVSKVASLYQSNPFHNFEHASHVSMSVHKLWSRIVASESHSQPQPQLEQAKTAASSSSLDSTYGLKADPLIQFTVTFSALIHDLDHPGVSNAQFMKENPSLAQTYNGHCVAEQNSVALAWNELALSGAYPDLCAAIFATEAELRHFRQLLVNAVLATDIFDSETSARRKQRWSLAFDESSSSVAVNTVELANRKATVVIEHLIQASDVSHTMQHWHVYQKWNQRLFDEIMTAHRAGRCEKDPSIGWYDGELWFFDNYVIPLAHKLKECGVFGVSSDEYLTYALQNRSEWQAKGRDVVQALVTAYNNKHAAVADDDADQGVSKL